MRPSNHAVRQRSPNRLVAFSARTQTRRERKRGLERGLTTQALASRSYRLQGKSGGAPKSDRRASNVHPPGFITKAGAARKTHAALERGPKAVHQHCKCILVSPAHGGHQLYVFASFAIHRSAPSTSITPFRRGRFGLGWKNTSSGQTSQLLDLDEEGLEVTLKSADVAADLALAEGHAPDLSAVF